MMVNRISQPARHLTSQVGFSDSLISVSKISWPEEKPKNFEGPLDAFAINRIAWEQAMQMVRAKHQMRNRVGRFFE